MSHTRYSVALASDVARRLNEHLLQHIAQGHRQEDMCFALGDLVRARPELQRY